MFVPRYARPGDVIYTDRVPLDVVDASGCRVLHCGQHVLEAVTELQSTIKPVYQQIGIVALFHPE